MNDSQVSLMGRLVRDVMKNMMDSAMGHKFQTGEYRMDPKEPAWLCPSGFEYEIISMDRFKMEYLRPAGVCTGRAVLQLHGGGYIGPMKNIYRDFAVQYSLLSRAADVLTADYRVAPEHPFPAALEDAVTAYQWLIGTKAYDPERIVVAGDSAGGGLSLALIHYLKDHGIPLPAGIIVMSPWTDVTCSGASYETNYTRDPQFGGTTDSMLYHNPYVGEADPQDPYLSPLFGDFSGFPPVLIQVGSEEMLLDDSRMLAEKLRGAHGKLRLSIYDGMFHVFQMAYRLIPESRDAWEEVGRFLEIIYGIRWKKAGQPVRRVRSGRKRSEQP
ncbi:MAG: alpha/beta hydrolase [Clostridiales bacterium]|nr:alpha/beta hydrolase [Clostridiales bacterium]